MADPYPMIDRAFVRLDEGLVHYRSLGSRETSTRPPLYMAHAGPGSSKSMIGFMQAMGDGRHVIAADTLGYGDSDPPAQDPSDIPYFADVVLRTLDKLGIDQIDFYGSHTGALIGMELAINRKDRVRKLILDGVLIFTPEEKADLLAHYAPKIVLDDHGAYLSWVWQFIRDMSLFFPHYRREPGTRTGNGTAPPAQLYAGVSEVIKALTTYHIPYNAAFSYDVESALPRIDTATLVTCSSWDPMHVYLDQTSAMVKGSRKRLFAATETPADKAAFMTAFLDEPA